MKPKRILAGVLTIILAACTLGPTPPVPTGTPIPTLPPGVTLSITASPTIPPSPTPAAEIRLQTGDEAFFNGDYNLAEIEYQAALDSSTDPEVRAAALWGLGRVESLGGNKGKALNDLWNLANSYPDSANATRAYFYMGKIYSALGRNTEAAEAYSVYLALHPGLIDFYIQERRGDAYNSTGNYTEAIAAYQAALAAPHISDDTTIQIEIAQAYASSGDSAAALARYDAIAAASSNDYVRAQMDLLSGQLYYSLGQTDQAYQRFLHAVDNYPLAYDSYTALVTLVEDGIPVDEMSRGLTDYFAGQYGYALAAFQRYVSANPDNGGTVYYYIALASRKIDNYQDAIDQLTYFIENFPENRLLWQSAWGEKADIQEFDLYQYDAAVQTLLDYSIADPGSFSQTMFLVGRIYERAGRLDDAARTWENIADTEPGSDLVPQALFLAGIARYRNGNYDQALLTFQRDLLLSTAAEDQARASFWMGKTEQALGDSTAAQASWQQAASLDPTGYYSLRAQDMLFDRLPFAPPSATNLTVNLATERREAEAWMRITFGLAADTDLSTPGDLLSDARLVRGTELWNLGLYDEARFELENLRVAVENDPADCYRLANYLLDLGLYRSGITAARQVLTLAGMAAQSQTLAAPRFFNHVRYGFYYQDVILPAAEQNNLNPFFLYSVIRQESLFEGFVRSTAGARGLMQIVPSTGQYIVDTIGWPPGYTSDDLYLPIVNVNLGAHYLKSNRNFFDGSLYAALAAYNGGPGNAQAWLDLSGPDPDSFLEVIRFQETSDYIRAIYEIYNMYLLLYGATP